MVEIQYDKNLFFIQQKFADSTAALTFLSQQLITQGYAKPGYTEAILAREQVYPTGLPSAEPRVAIPHADSKLINKTTIAVATLQQPVAFHDMEEVKTTLDISMIIMLAIKEPHGQIEMLQSVVGIIQNTKLMHQIVGATSQDELYQLIMTNL
ncbi:MAG: PTS sugar transporter subunit IIA [Lactobacillus sp.]|jgi:PTS system galactitol-specific IIA component|nr:PTS sugar transporter subunit IIA [Lactobacillus sp.]MCI2033639.1 PTS sugar transporter subunit IIA [Lactobacillus sp.]